MGAPIEFARGRITRLNKTGVGFITTDDSRASRPELVFSYDRIRREQGETYAPYRGEPLKELGLREGTRVAFSENGDGLIESVEVDQ